MGAYICGDFWGIAFISQVFQIVSKKEPIYLRSSGATGVKEQRSLRNTRVWSEFDGVSDQGSLVSVTFLVIKRSNMSGVLFGSIGK